MGKGRLNIQMALNIKENGYRIGNKEWELTENLMVKNILGCLLMECVKDRVKLEPKVGIIIKESGKMGLRMAKVKKLTKMV